MPLCFYVTYKDIQLILLRSNGIMQSIMLGLLLIIVFSLAQKVGEQITPQTAAALFTLANVFCVILITNALFSLENHDGIRAYIALSSISPASFALGKWIALLILLVITQVLLLPIMFILFNQALHSFSSLCIGVLLFDTGMASTGILLGAITQQSTSKDSMLTVLLFPLLLPLLLATIRIIEYACSREAEPILSWIGVGSSFVLFFFVALIILFPVLFSSHR